MACRKKKNSKNDAIEVHFRIGNTGHTIIQLPGSAFILWPLTSHSLKTLHENLLNKLSSKSL